MLINFTEFLKNLEMKYLKKRKNYNNNNNLR